jgi:hypothetical protein
VDSAAEDKALTDEEKELGNLKRELRDCREHPAQADRRVSPQR